MTSDLSLNKSLMKGGSERVDMPVDNEPEPSGREAIVPQVVAHCRDTVTKQLVAVIVTLSR